MWYIERYEILFNREKQENPAICDNVDGPQEHYAK